MNYFVICSVMSESLWPHGLECTRFLSPPLSPQVFSNLSIEQVMLSNHLILCCPLLLLPSIYLSIRVFSKAQLFASGGQSTEASGSASVLPMNILCWFLWGMIGLISLLFKGLSRIFSSTKIWKLQFFFAQLCLWNTVFPHFLFFASPQSCTHTLLSVYK